MKQVLFRGGRVLVEETPAPRPGDGELLVRTAWSLISAGTEASAMRASETPATAGRWLNRARKAGEALRLVATRGIADGLHATRERLRPPAVVPGYSLSGTVIEVGRAVDEFVPGQLVACAGALAATHAEVVSVPRRLVAPVPQGLPLEHAAFVTIGAIALHGVRQADVRLGEIVFVAGLGLVGTLTCELLRTAGCRVVACDLDAERVARARAMDIDAIDARKQDAVDLAVRDATGGRGADAVLLAVSSRSAEPLARAVELVRPRGRIVVVGALPLEIDRDALYMKEAELRIARSYGPGRHDPSYEVEGHDYPYPYVRWTENRNMREFLRLAGSGQLSIEPLCDRTFAVDDAARAYGEACRGAGPTLGVLLRYPAADDLRVSPEIETSVDVVSCSRPSGLAVALVGPGSFARAVHLPNLAGLAPKATLRSVVGRRPADTREVARRFAATAASTDLDAVLVDDEIDALLICTRHDRHADEAIRALEAGKAVFLEKPAATTIGDLQRLETALREHPRPFTVGFNRRFAPTVAALVPALHDRRGALVIDYRVSAGRLPAEHWLRGREGGGRLIGEGCHMLDLIGHLVDRPLLDSVARGGLGNGDNVAVTLRYTDGSLATLTYTAEGDPTTGKERIECHWDGRSAVIDDFRDDSGTQDKGHSTLLRRFVEHALGEAPPPIPLDEVLTASRLAIELHRTMRGLQAEADG